MTTHAAGSMEGARPSHYGRLLVMVVFSLIPHHAGAVLMCDEASLRDAGIRESCNGESSRVAQDSTAVATTVERYHSALADGDSAAALSLLGDDALVLESGEIETREQYRSHHLPADIEFARGVPSTRAPPRVFVG